MATITKKVNRGVPAGTRYQYWISTENADDATVIAAGDIFRVNDSLGYPAKYLWIETLAGTGLKIRLNPRVPATPMREENKNYPNRPAIEDQYYIQDDTMAAMAVGDGEIWDIHNVLPVYDIEIVAFGGGGFEILVA